MEAAALVLDPPEEDDEEDEEDEEDEDEDFTRLLANAGLG